MSPLLVLEHEPIAELGQDDIADLLIKLENDENRPMIDPATTIGRRFALPFYDDVTLIELRDPNWAPAGARLCFLETDEALERLDGTSPLIHKVNAQRGPILSRSTVLQYLAFFCFFVRGEEGPFFILDRVQGSRFLPDIYELPEIEEEFREPMIWGDQNPDGSWRTSAMVYYSNALFLSDFEIMRTGMIEMKDDTPIHEGLSGLIMAPLSIESATTQ